MKFTVFFVSFAALVCAKNLELSKNFVPNKFIIEVEHTSGLSRRGDVIHVWLSTFDRVTMLNYSAASRRGIPPDQVS
jgi:hypothetical protein